MRACPLWQRLCFGFSVGVGLWFSTGVLHDCVARDRMDRAKATQRDGYRSHSGFFRRGYRCDAILVGNIGHGFPSLSQNWASKPASSIGQGVEYFVWLGTYMLPKLLFRSSGWWSETTVLIVAYALVAVGFVIAMRRNLYNSGGSSSPRDAGLLLLLVLAACMLIFSASQAGTGRGWTVRKISRPSTSWYRFFVASGLKRLEQVAGGRARCRTANSKPAALWSSRQPASRQAYDRVGK